MFNDYKMSLYLISDILSQANQIDLIQLYQVFNVKLSDGVLGFWGFGVFGCVA